MRIAVVHDWLEVYAGAERVLEQILKLYPQADLFTLVDFLPPRERKFLARRVVRTSFVQHLPLARKYFRHYLPLFPWAIGRFDLSGYSLIISSSHCVAKGVRVRPGQAHVCYCHTPMRYAWDMQREYLARTGYGRGLQGRLVRGVLAGLRRWDTRTAPRVTQFVANSRFIARRIGACYGRDAVVVHPPVAMPKFRQPKTSKEYYLTVSRLVPYKRVAMIAQAFAAMPEKKLVIIGSGPEAGKIERLAATAPNISYLGWQPEASLQKYLREARAFVFAAKEDFGMAPVEAMAAGVPVIAFGQGGVAESVRGLEHPQPTGVLFRPQTIQALCRAVRSFERHAGRISPRACRERAGEFGVNIFRRRFAAVVRNIAKQALLG